MKLNELLNKISDIQSQVDDLHSQLKLVTDNCKALLFEFDDIPNDISEIELDTEPEKAS